jgi:hypothetical protein
MIDTPAVCTITLSSDPELPRDQQRTTRLSVGGEQVRVLRQEFLKIPLGRV